jgi:hypothetical protein
MRSQLNIMHCIVISVHVNGYFCLLQAELVDEDEDEDEEDLFDSDEEVAQKPQSRAKKKGGRSTRHNDRDFYASSARTLASHTVAPSSGERAFPCSPHAPYTYARP